MADQMGDEAEAQDRSPVDLSAFGKAIAKLRDEAQKARKDSGIEDVWTYCEEAYTGIDDENRAEFAAAKWAKPYTGQGPLVNRGNSSDGVRSTAFVRLTARYVDAGAAKIGEITLPVDGPPMKLDPTPVPELMGGLEDEREVLNNGQPVMRAAEESDPGVPGEDGQEVRPEKVPLKVKDLARRQMEKAEEKAKAATDRIYDWLAEGKHVAQMRKVEFDMARLGVGVLKGPVPFNRKAKAVTSTDNGVEMSIVTKLVPRTVWVDPWNFFPAPDCGENIHDGGGVFERDFLSPKALEALKGQPGYIPEAIDKVLKEGPEKINLEGVNPGERNESKRFTVWYGYCEIGAEELLAANPEGGDDEFEEGEKVHAIVTLVNDTVIKAVANPLDSGAFPYHAAPWRRRAGHWAGIGVAEQCKLPQRGINAATRALFNNAGKSAGTQLVINRSRIEPADTRWAFTPDKVWWDNDPTGAADVRTAFYAFTPQNATNQLMSIIEYNFRLAEESTSIPLITQGFSGDTTPDTFGATQIQNNNANQLLRDVGYSVADNITNPLGDQLYEWLLLDPDVPDEEKGDYQVNINAAAVMIERAVHDQTIMQMGPLVGNPAFGLNPKLWAAQMLRSKRLNPEDFQYTEAELAEQAKNQALPPQIAVAQIRAQSAEKIAEGRDAASVQKMQVDTDRDRAYVDSQARRDEASANLKLEELRLKVQLAQLDYANREKISLQDAKVRLADTAMKLKTTKELAYADMAASDGKNVVEKPMPTPAVEPPGQAEQGQSYAQ